MATMGMTRGGGGYVQRSGSSGLYEILDLILDKGLVIDVFLRVSLVGIELLTVDARIVIASVDTYLRFAEAVNRLDLGSTQDSEGLPGLVEDMTEGGAQSKSRGVLEGAKDALFGSDNGDQEEQEKEKETTSSSSSRSGSSRGRSTRGRRSSS